MELPKRKRLRLDGYDYSQNGAYFITICTQNRECILGKIVGDDAHIVPQIQLSEYGIVIEKYLNGIIGVDKFIIMPNHIHLVIFINLSANGTMWASSPTNQSIPQLIKSFKILVTKGIGLSLFQRSYHDHIIRNEQEYQKIWQYIDTNPLKWDEDCFYVK
ncbi:MAG: transposase [Oscillospiraceae bacterium]